MTNKLECRDCLAPIESIVRAKQPDAQIPDPRPVYVARPCGHQVRITVGSATPDELVLVVG